MTRFNFRSVSLILASIILAFSSLAHSTSLRANPEPVEGLAFAEVKTMDTSAEQSRSIKLVSSAFKEGEMIPIKYSCDGDNFSPPLSWYNLPVGTKTLALICDDPDAPAKVWVHWVIFNIPATLKGLPENVAKQKILPDGTRQGAGSADDIGYEGPCPPSGTHRYYFKIFALDTEISSAEVVNKNQLLTAMEGHILARGQLMGKYSRK